MRLLNHDKIIELGFEQYSALRYTKGKVTIEVIEDDDRRDRFKVYADNKEIGYVHYTQTLINILSKFES